MHANTPWVVTFDDHEVDNDWAGRSRRIPPSSRTTRSWCG